VNRAFKEEVTMKRMMVFILIVCWTIPAYATSLKPEDISLIESAGVPVYPKATFVYGNPDVGFRFAASLSAEEVRQWYREKLPQWSVLDAYGSWILYNGKPGAGLGEVMSMNQVLIQKNENLPGWYSVEKNMTTEIVIMIVKK
jgi:hypothetical protein